MLRIRVQTNAGAARGYFGRAGGECDAGEADGRGVWGGRAAERLGLVGAVGADSFARLCDNRHPHAGDPLTPRTASARRVGWDVSFHCPKSVSLLYGLTGDPALLAAFRDAVAATMVELEADAGTRVRRGGADADRPTANLVWAAFVHAAARPVNGAPDPHLHAHCLVFNLTFDPVEGRFKAVQPEPLYRNARYLEAAFHARLAVSLTALGFDVDRTPAGWEVTGMPADLLRRFSRRTAVIERAAAERGVTDPRAKDALGAMTRERKPAGRLLGRLRAEWQARLSPADRVVVLAVLGRRVPPAPPDPAAARDAVRFAVAHMFERRSVVGVRVLLAVALRAGVGKVTPERMAAELPAHDLIVRTVAGEVMATTREVVEEERALLAFARDGRGRCRPFAPADRPVADARLSAGQRAAVRHVLASADRVILVRGAAGTGKTTVLAECVRGIEATGKEVVVLAPTADASRGALRNEGFPAADTVARFLTDSHLQRRAAGQVVWVDEAGLLGGRDAARLVRLAAALGTRVILGGDRRQHPPVPRGSVLELLETEAGLVPAAVTAIRRQRGRYREAVALLARGRAAAGLDVLDDLGWVRELADPVRPAALAAEYMAAVRAGQSVLVVAPTHAEGRIVTAAVRDALRADGRLANAEFPFARLESRDLTVAERGRAESYAPGDVVEFHRAAKGVRAGERWAVTSVVKDRVEVRAGDGRTAALPIHLAERFGVYTPRELLLAVGDRVRVTKSGRATGGRRVDNGSLHTVAKFSPDGGVVLASGTILPPGFAHLAHGYASTSPAAQGKTVDVVLVAESTRSFPAAGREQWYVSVSRGRARAVVFTDDKAALRRAVERTRPRPTATWLLASHPSTTGRANKGRGQRDRGRSVGLSAAAVVPVPSEVCRGGERGQ